MKSVTVVIPTYNEEENLPEMVKALFKIFEGKPYKFRVLVIDNASTDGTQMVLRDMALADKRVQAIFNLRNFGHVRSPYYGLLQAHSDAAIYMAADFQDPPELIAAFLEHWEEGADVVMAQRQETEEVGLIRPLRSFFYWLLDQISETEIVRNATGFGLYSRDVLDDARSVGDHYPFFRGLIGELGYRPKIVSFVQPVRKKGISKNRLYSLYDVAMLAFTKHSVLPLRLAMLFSFCATILSIIVAAFYLFLKLTDWYGFSGGVTPLIILMTFLFGVQFFVLGMIGEYLITIYRLVRKEPIVNERLRLNLDERSYSTKQETKSD